MFPIKMRYSDKGFTTDVDVYKIDLSCSEDPVALCWINDSWHVLSISALTPMGKTSLLCE